MKTSFHTHTFRCRHATGTEEEYIKRALECGVVALGFADHAPYPTDDIKLFAGSKMDKSEVGEYVDTLKALREKYRGKIEIYIGFEAEYHPKYFPLLLDLLRPFDYDYMILGQHFAVTDTGVTSSFSAHDDPALLRAYVNNVCEAIETGAFSYVAHPDAFNFTGNMPDYKTEMARICACAKAHGVPLEINGLGIRDARPYPNPRFFPLMEKAQNTVVYGCDAHDTQNAWDEASYQTARAVALNHNLEFLERTPIHKPK